MGALFKVRDTNVERRGLPALALNSPRHAWIAQVWMTHLAGMAVLCTGTRADNLFPSDCHTPPFDTRPKTPQTPDAVLQLRSFHVKTLTTAAFDEVEVPLGFQESAKGKGAWNGLRSVPQLSLAGATRASVVSDRHYIPEWDSCNLSLRCPSRMTTMHAGCSALVTIFPEANLVFPEHSPGTGTLRTHGPILTLCKSCKP